MTTLTQAEKRFLVDRAKADLDYFWGSVLGCPTVYGKQLQMAKAVRDYNRVAVVGANGTGKDWHERQGRSTGGAPGSGEGHRQGHAEAVQVTKHPGHS